MTTNEIDNFSDKVIEVVKTWFKSAGFHARKLTDTPTDALQVVNRKFVTQNGVSASRPTSSIMGLQYFDTSLNKPIYWNSIGWVDSQSNYV